MAQEIAQAQQLAQQQSQQQQNMQQQVKKAQQQQEQKQQYQEQRRVILKAILSPEARQRLSNLAMVKEERATQIENMIIQQHQSGMISGKVSENHVKMLLEQISEKESKKKNTVTIDRK
eukprot:256789_1